MATVDKQRYIEKAVSWVEKKGYSNIKACFEGYEEPTSFTQQSNNSSVTPDITATFSNNKYYFDVAVKSIPPSDTASKWKLLAFLANAKQGKFYVFTPHGHKAYAQRIIGSHNINAELVAI